MIGYARRQVSKKQNKEKGHFGREVKIGMAVD